MRVLVLSGRTARQPWTHGAIVQAICSALAARGHAVVLAAQSIDEPRAFAGCEAVHAFDSFDQTATDWPLGFATWARRRRGRIPHDVSVSLSRLVGGDVWMPLDPSAAAWLARAARSLSVPSLAIALARHCGVFRAWAGEAFFVAPIRGDDESIRRVLAIGPARDDAARRLQRARGLGERVRRVEPFAAIVPPSETELRALRDRTRAILGIAPNRRVVLVSAPRPVGKLLDPLLLAVRELALREGEGSPVMLALARDGYAVHSRAVRCAAVKSLRVMGLTERMDAALAAADMVALPIRAERGVFEQGGAGRLAADALALGRPLLALAGSVGSSLARLRSSGDDSPGIVVEQSSRELWSRALRQACEAGWAVRSAAAAREVAGTLTFERFMEALDTALHEAARERGAPAIS